MNTDCKVEVEQTNLLAKLARVAISGVGQYDARRNLVGDGAANQVERQLGLGAEFDIGGNARFLPSRSSPVRDLGR